MVLNPQAFNGIVTFATTLTTATDPCNPKGSSRVYAIDFGTVQSVLQPSVAGDPNPPFVVLFALTNLKIAGVNGKPEILAGGNGGNGQPQYIPSNMTGTLAMQILNWREIPTVE
jgi:type IV pilus assembly protein PilY1